MSMSLDDLETSDTLRRHRALVDLLTKARDNLAVGNLQSAIDTVQTVYNNIDKLPVGLRPLKGFKPTV